jgi:hypothetical protein
LGLADKLCHLLSIARGTRVNWIFYTALNIKGGLIYSEHQPRITRPYTPNSPIHPEGIEDTKSFVEVAYKGYDEIDSIYQGNRIVNLYTQTRLESAFIETRGLILVSLVDHILGVFAKGKEHETIMDPQLFSGRNKKKLRRRIGDVVQEIFPDLDKNQIKEMKYKTAGFNYRSLNSKFTDIINEYDAPINDEEVRAFVKIRNDLVHQATFTENEAASEYFQILNMLDRLLLSMLGYEGYYLNVTNNEREPLKPDLTA